MNNSLSQIIDNFTKIHPIFGKQFTNSNCIALDLSKSNVYLKNINSNNEADLEEFIWHQIKHANAKYAIGGYAENRTLYQNHEHFGTGLESRSLHLGVDIWAKAGQKIYAPIVGQVHSFANNNNKGDYGPTIILEHKGIIPFYTLYGHLSEQSLQDLFIGKTIEAGTEIATLGDIKVNGGWVPHLHFQVIYNLQGKTGDYAGVCKPSESEFYLDNCPNPSPLLL